LRAFGRVDILVLTAGGMPSGFLNDVDDAAFKSVYDLTVKGPLFLAQAVAPHLTEGGRIFFFSSVATKKSTVLPNYLLLVSSGGAIEQICRALASDLGERGITVNTISPGPIDSEGYRAGKSEHMLQFIRNLHMQKRIGMPSEIAEVIGFLATKDGRWINGQNIPINGGIVV